MATRTIPSIMPVVATTEIGIGRPLKADVFRRLAQAQNYLWANIRRAYAFWANDGEGNFLSGKTLGNTGAASRVGGWEDPGVVDPLPGGTTAYAGLCVSTFVIPPAQVGNTRAKFQGRAKFDRQTSTGIAGVRLTLHELGNSEAFSGSYAEATISASTDPWDWSFEIDIPTNRPIVGKLWIGGLLGGPTAGTAGAYDLLTLFSLSGRWLCPAAFASASTGKLTFEPTEPDDVVADRCVDVAVLDQVRRQIASLAGSRGQTEIIQTYFGSTGNNANTYSEVGRYTVYVSAAVNLITVRIYVLTTENGSGNYPEVILKWDGSTVATFSPVNHTQFGVGAYEASFAPSTNDAEHTLTIEAKCKNTSTNYGGEVLGVFAWESGIDTSGWPEAPGTDFKPLDESRLKANDYVSANLEPIASARTGLQHLLRNNLWLAKHRLRSLVGDWRRRVLKRIADESGNLASPAGGIWDWTRGLQNAGTLQNSKPKNITVRGDLITNDGWARGAANHDSLDGFGVYATGYSDTSASGVTSSWPGTQTYRGHGRRLSVVYCGVPSGYSMHASDGTATSSFFARAARRRVAIMGPTFNGGTLGPAVEESNWKNRGSLEVDWPSTGGLSLPIRSTAPAAIDDHQLRWLPVQSKLSYIGEGKVRGRLPIAFIPIASANVLEGTLFEVELSALLVMDDPLPLASLAALA